MTRYKLTDEHLRTYGGCQWGEGVTHETSGKGELCGSGWLHVYNSPELAVLMNPLHADFKNPVLWKCRVSGAFETDHGLKEGWTKVTTLSQMKPPAASNNQRIAFAILCALRVYKEKSFQEWAKEWLSRKNRSADAAYAAYAAADSTKGRGLNFKVIAKRALKENW